MLCMMRQKIVEIVKVGEVLEDGFKIGRVTNITALRYNGKTTRICDIDTSKRKAEEVVWSSYSHAVTFPKEVSKP